MNLDRNKLKSLRADRGWSQEQLATASGLSLRTVQRIERTGVGANESAQALASVFDTSVQSLRLTTRPVHWSSTSLRIGGGFAAGAFAGLVLMSGMTASAVDLTVKTFLNHNPVAERKQSNGDQRPVTVSLVDSADQEQARLRIVTSELDNGNVRFDLVIYNCDANGCKEAGHPAMETRFGKPARVQWDKATGEVIAYELTPTR